jgi:hypothetical protein
MSSVTIFSEAALTSELYSAAPACLYESIQIGKKKTEIMRIYPNPVHASELKNGV